MNEMTKIAVQTTLKEAKAERDAPATHVSRLADLAQARLQFLHRPLRAFEQLHALDDHAAVRCFTHVVNGQTSH